MRFPTSWFLCFLLAFLLALEATGQGKEEEEEVDGSGGGGKGGGEKEDTRCCLLCCNEEVNRARPRTVLRLLSPPLASVHEGGTLTASCAISNHIHPPTEVEWRHNGTRMLAQGTHLDPLRMRQDAEAGADDLVRSLAVDTVAGRRATVSRLTLAKVDYPEAGNYTCVPIGLYEDDYDVVSNSVFVTVSPQPEDAPAWAKGAADQSQGEAASLLCLAIVGGVLFL